MVVEQAKPPAAPFFRGLFEEIFFRPVIWASIRLLHDCDYWLANYGISLKIAPADWDGANVYFGCLERLKVRIVLRSY